MWAQLILVNILAGAIHSLPQDDGKTDQQGSNDAKTPRMATDVNVHTEQTRPGVVPAPGVKATDVHVHVESAKKNPAGVVPNPMNLHPKQTATDVNVHIESNNKNPQHPQMNMMGGPIGPMGGPMGPMGPLGGGGPLMPPNQMGGPMMQPNQMGGPLGPMGAPQMPPNQMGVPMLGQPPGSTDVNVHIDSHNKGPYPGMFPQGGMMNPQMMQMNQGMPFNPSMMPNPNFQPGPQPGNVHADINIHQLPSQGLPPQMGVNMMPPQQNIGMGIPPMPMNPMNPQGPVVGHNVHSDVHNHPQPGANFPNGMQPPMPFNPSMGPMGPGMGPMGPQTGPGMGPMGPGMGPFNPQMNGMAPGHLHTDINIHQSPGNFPPFPPMGMQGPMMPDSGVGVGFGGGMPMFGGGPSFGSFPFPSPPSFGGPMFGGSQCSTQCRTSFGQFVGIGQTWVEGNVQMQCAPQMEMVGHARPSACVDQMGRIHMPGQQWSEGPATFQCQFSPFGLFVKQITTTHTDIIVPQTGKQQCHANGRMISDGETFQEGPFLKQCVTAETSWTIKIIRCIDQRGLSRHAGEQWNFGLTHYECVRDAIGGLTMRPTGPAPATVVQTQGTTVTAVSSPLLNPAAGPMPVPPMVPPPIAPMMAAGGPHANAHAAAHAMANAATPMPHAQPPLVPMAKGHPPPQQMMG